MESNKDEALEAKEIAEKKFTEMDVHGALRFAEKAQSMCPNLDGLIQLLVTLNIHVAAENKINGEADWYRVLGVQPSAEDETIRRNYGTLAYLLNSDTNKAVGSDSAFKILPEGWSVLSDKVKRISYDQRRNFESRHVINSNGKFPVLQSDDHFYSPGPSSQNFNPSDSTGATSAAAVAPPYEHTFWTACSACKVHYRCFTQYVNHHFRCPNCHECFVAVEILPPPISNRGLFTSGASSSNERLSGNADSMGFCCTGLSGKSPHGVLLLPQFGSATTLPSPALSTAGFRSTLGLEPTQNTHISLQTNGAVLGMLSRNASFASKIEAGRPWKKRQPTGITKIGGARTSCPNGKPELSQFETRSLLMQKARTEVRKKLSEGSMAKQVAVKSSSSKKVKEQHKEMENASCNGARTGVSKLGVSMCVKEADKTEKPPLVTSTVDMEANSVAKLMSVPDPDFYDFDKNRVESSFGDKQIWAVYDDEDGMPRYYALVHGVISVKPFKVQISWLSCKSNLEFSPLKWVGSGYPKTCGDLRIGKSEVYGSLNAFSHIVKWKKGPRGIIQIYPAKGDIWAVYRNWSPDWNEFTQNEVIHSYDMVEVLEDYSEDCGATVAPLVKVPGFRTIFQKHLDPSRIWTIPREEMFRFSHQVPSYKLSGKEAAQAPEGCWELDPASTPLELLQIVAEHSKEQDVLIDSKMPTGEIGVNGDIATAGFSEMDAKKSKLEEAGKAGEVVQGKKLLVYERRRKGRKQT